MENTINSLINQQACESASIFQNNEEKKKKQENRAKRFGDLSVGCLLYALFYTFCLYRNRSGITAPFFIGGTLFFCGYYFKKSGVTAVKENRFWMMALMMLGIVTCMTDSEVLINLNSLLSIVLFSVILLQNFHQEKAAGWRVSTWSKAVVYLICGSMGQIGKPFMDGIAYFKSRNKKAVDGQQKEKQRQIAGAVLIGVAVSMPILCIVGLLLISADALFFQMCSHMAMKFLMWEIPEWALNGAVIRIALMIICVFIYAYAVLVYCRKKNLIEQATEEKKTEWDAYIAITFTAMIAVMYCLFCGVQIFGLFLGKMKLPEGYTYAGYARQGFFQLLFVCLFNICLVLVCLACFKAHKVLQVMLTVISACTYIMIASSAYRMLLYISSYHLTFLRVFVLWALAVIAVLMAGVICRIYHADFRLFHYMLVTVTVGYLCFATVHPDYWIAKYNISRMEQGEDVDTWYLSRYLSADAAPAFTELNVMEQEAFGSDVKSIKEDYYNRIIEKTDDMHVRNWNISRAVARSLAEKEQGN